VRMKEKEITKTSFLKVRREDGFERILTEKDNPQRTDLDKLKEKVESDVQQGENRRKTPSRTREGVL